jgi:Secretion system C-terminal sorting domain
MSGFSNPWTNSNSTKNWRMTITFYSAACGWTGAVTHFFKINTACPSWLSSPNPGNGGSDAAWMETSERTEDLANNQGPSVVAFPNPVSDLLWLNLSGFEGADVDIAVYDLTGKLLHTQSQPNTYDDALSIEVAHLPPGTYLYHCQSADRQYQGKFLKY